MIPMAQVVFGSGPTELAGRPVQRAGDALELLLRRQWPFAVLAAAVFTAVLGILFALQLVVAVYTIGANRSSKATIAAVGVVVAIVFVYVLAGGSRGDLTGVIPIALLSVSGAGTGRYIGNKRTSITTLGARA